VIERENGEVSKCLPKMWNVDDEFLDWDLVAEGVCLELNYLRSSSPVLCRKTIGKQKFLGL
jgi:hypothetical protein